jgi:hypothetical protein
VTWANGSIGSSSAFSTAISLYGTSTNDRIGSDDVTALSNGHYVVGSEKWTNGGTAEVGAATWGSGTTGINGAVSTANSLYGTTAMDHVGGSTTALTNGNYVVTSWAWDNGGIAAVGAVTWGNGTTGITGAVSTANSLYGTTAGDDVGRLSVTALSNGNYVVDSGDWDNGAIADAGAVTWGDGTTGITGAVSTANSLHGTTANDKIGISLGGGDTVVALANGNYAVWSPNWDNGGTVDAERQRS